MYATAPIGSMENEALDQLLTMNIKSVFYTLRAAANIVETNGRIIAIGSASKVGGFAGVGAYSATKAAVEVLALTLSQEVGSRGITVNSIHPGPTDTGTLHHIRMFTT
jgi:3-oxoacyl-[acyl-carrier protein] reductase